MAASDPGMPPGAAQEGRQPTEEELRVYVEQLRQAPVGQVVGEVVSALLNAAQFKLGRHDARLLLDLTAQAIETTRPYLDADLVRQVDDAIAQLRMGQVQAERELATRGGSEDNDIGSVTAVPGGQADGQPRAPGQPAGSPPTSPPETSKLWIPGR